MLKKLVNRVLDDSVEPNIMMVKKIESVLADGAHDTNRNFRYLEHRRIKPRIKIRKNSIISGRNNSLRNREVRLQIENLLKWKKKSLKINVYPVPTIYSCSY